MNLVRKINIDKLPFDNFINDKVVYSLFNILKNEQLNQNKSSLVSSKEFMSSENKISTFYEHENLLSSEYGKIEPLKIFRLNKNVVNSLSDYLAKQNLIKIDEVDCNQHKYLYLTEFSNPEKTKKINENISFYDIKMDGFLLNFHEYLRKFLLDYIKSPFSFVNTRAWITKPGSSRFGANAPHHDGFHQGHLKLMIYLSPLSNEFGEFWIENKTLTNQEKGTCIIFKNSDYLHSGVPGTKHPRISMEITIMRTFVNCPQFHEGNINGRHYYDVNTPYNYFL